MALSIHQQIHQLLEEKKNILVTFPKLANNDSAASAVAVLLWLEKLGKTADAVADGFLLPKTLKFLPKAGAIKPAFGHLQKFILMLDVKNTGVEELSYDIKNDSLRIHVTPKQGFLTREHVKTAQTDFRYDLIITVGARDLQSLGALYENNADLFFKTPIVNIDHHPANERFGQINIVDTTAGATAEAVYALIKKMGEEYIDEQTATALLTGIISATRSFKSDALKPQTLQTASALMALGANRDGIVNELYRTRSIATLQLWGSTLSHLAEDESIGLVWSAITRDDFVRAGASERDLYEMLDEISGMSPAAKYTLILHEHSSSSASGGLRRASSDQSNSDIHCILRAPKGVSAKELMDAFQPEGTNGEASFTIVGKGLKQAEEEVLSYLKKNLQKISNS